MVYGPVNETENWQAIDAGHYGACIKAKSKEFLEVWMHEDYKGKHAATLDRVHKNWEMWEQNKITAREKRILMTFIFGNAWDAMCTKKYANFIRAGFEKTGLLLTRTGKNDNMVTMESIKDCERANSH